VVKEDLIDNHPEVVSKLIEVSQKAPEWADQYPDQAAEVLARQLGSTGEGIFPTEVAEVTSQLEITQEVLLKSMARMEYTMAIDPEVVQQVIDYLAELGYIKNSFAAEEILDLSFLEDEMA
jgi:NitT/TauT family transport system substrate-binding protein